MIIDAHLHLDDKASATATGAAKELSHQLKEAGINYAVVLHLEKQPWTKEEFAEAIVHFPELMGFVNLHPDKENVHEALHHSVMDLGYQGLKLHPRLQEFDVSSKSCIKLVSLAGDLGVPVLIDAFPDGTHIMQGFSPLKYAYLAKECPHTNIIWAHMGGHYVFDFLMLAKRLPNVYMDTSYSLLYYQGSSVPSDIVYAMRSMRFEKVFYGSDYPDRSVKQSLDLSIQFLEKFLSVSEMENILFKNANTLFKFE
jgi:predicted TIM-barrel fold metal-dependent hydrolase